MRRELLLAALAAAAGAVILRDVNIGDALDELPSEVVPNPFDAPELPSFPFPAIGGGFDFPTPDILRGPYGSGGFADPLLPDRLPGGHNEFDNQIRYSCQQLNMPDPLAPLFVKATIVAESGWRIDAAGDYRRPGSGVSNSACEGPYRGSARYAGYCSIGLMQVNRAAHPHLASSYDLRDPDQNIFAGCIVLAGAYRRWWPDYERVRATYQGGPVAGDAWPELAGFSTANVAALRAGVAHVTRTFHTYVAQLGMQA